MAEQQKAPQEQGLTEERVREIVRETMAGPLEKIVTPIVTAIEVECTNRMATQDALRSLQATVTRLTTRLDAERAESQEVRSSVAAQDKPAERGVDSVKLKIEVDTDDFLDGIREGVQQIAQEAARDFLLGELRKYLDMQSKPGGLLYRSSLADYPPGDYVFNPETGGFEQERKDG